MFLPPQQVMTQLEAVDSGVEEVGRWLEDGDKLLGSFNLHGTKETIQGQLDRHRVRSCGGKRGGGINVSLGVVLMCGF